MSLAGWMHRDRKRPGDRGFKKRKNEDDSDRCELLFLFWKGLFLSGVLLLVVAGKGQLGVREASEE